MHCRSKNKKKTSIFIFLPTADSILCNSATNSTTEMADHFSFSTHSIDNKIVTYKLLSQFNPFLYCRQRNTIHLIIEFCDFFVLTDRLLFCASMRNKKKYCFCFFYYLPDRPTGQNSLVKVSINTELRNHGLTVIIIKTTKKNLHKVLAAIF